MAAGSALRAIFETFQPEVALASPELFSGRDASLAELAESLHDSGSIVIIYGDRGLGKTSLANQYALIARGEQELLKRVGLQDLSLSPDEYYDIIRLEGTEFPTGELVSAAALERIKGLEETSRRWTPTRRRTRIGFNWKVLSGERETESELNQPPVIKTTESVVSQITGAAARHFSSTGHKPLLIIDEFDKIGHRAELANLLMALRSFNGLRICVVGVADDYGSLVGEHASLERIIRPVAVKPMTHQELAQICVRSVDLLRRRGFEVDITRSANDLLCDLADGYPWYVHVLARGAFKTAVQDLRSRVDVGDVEQALTHLATERGALKYEKIYQGAIAGAPNRELVLRYIAQNSDATNPLVPFEGLRDFLLDVDPEINALEHVHALQSSRFQILAAGGPNLVSLVRYVDPAFRIFCRLRPAVHRLGDARSRAPGRWYRANVSEKKWQQAWCQAAIHRDDDTAATVVLGAPLYPGLLDLGQARSYVIKDVIVRHLRMCGIKVNDSWATADYGEQFALAAKAQGATADDYASDKIANASGSLRRLGIIHTNWEIPIRGNNPDLVQWAQRSFLKLYAHGYVISRSSHSDVCASCGFSFDTGGRCPRCDGSLTQPAQRQYLLRIAPLQDRLSKDLETSPWPNSVKKSQRALALEDFVLTRTARDGWPVPLGYCHQHGPQLVDDELLPIVNFMDSKIDSLQQEKSCRCSECGEDLEFEKAAFNNFFCNAASLLWLRGKRRGGLKIDDEGRHTFLVGGHDVMRYYLLLMRGWAAASEEIDGVVQTSKRPFSVLVPHGFVRDDVGKKMSKSRGSAVIIKDYLDTVGPDAIRLKLLTAASPERDFTWSEDELLGWTRFIRRVWDRCHPQGDSSGRARGEASATVDAAVEIAIAEVTDALGEHQFMPALASIRKLLSVMSDSGVTPRGIETLLTLLHPFAPHVTSELWELRTGRDLSIESWPRRSTISDADNMRIVRVHLDGRFITEITAPMSGADDAVIDRALSDPKVMSALSGKRVSRSFVGKQNVVVLVTGD